MTKTLRKYGTTYESTLGLARLRGRITVEDLLDDRTPAQRRALLNSMTVDGHLCRIYTATGGRNCRHSVYVPVLSADGKPRKKQKGTR